MVRMFNSFNISNKLNRLNNTAFMNGTVIVTFQNPSHKNKINFALYDISEGAFTDLLARIKYCTS